VAPLGPLEQWWLESAAKLGWDGARPSFGLTSFGSAFWRASDKTTRFVHVAVRLDGWLHWWRCSQGRPSSVGWDLTARTRVCRLPLDRNPEPFMSPPAVGKRSRPPLPNSVCISLDRCCVSQKCFLGQEEQKMFCLTDRPTCVCLPNFARYRQSQFLHDIRDRWHGADLITQCVSDPSLSTTSLANHMCPRGSSLQKVYSLLGRSPAFPPCFHCTQCREVGNSCSRSCLIARLDFQVGQQLCLSNGISYGE